MDYAQQLEPSTVVWLEVVSSMDDNSPVDSSVFVLFFHSMGFSTRAIGLNEDMYMLTVQHKPKEY